MTLFEARMRRGERVRAPTFSPSVTNIPTARLDKIPGVRLRYSFVSNELLTFPDRTLRRVSLRSDEMNPKRSRARKLFGKFLLILFGFLLGGIIAEIALRVAGYSYPEFYSLDQSRGYALRANAEGWYRKEGEAYIRINSNGLRDQEHSLTKPPDTI